MIKMRTGLRIRAALVIMISFLTGCEENKTNLVYELYPPDDLEEEVYGVYSNVINHRFSKQEYLVLQQQTDTTVHKDNCPDLYDAHDTTDLESLTIANYIENNQDSYNLDPAGFDVETQIKLITLEELNSYEGWESFHENYPKTHGLLCVTRPGFNKDSTQSLFEYTWETGEDLSEHYLVYLKKREEKWDIMAHETIDEE